MNEVVSVVIPAYNVEAYIEKCLESLIKQTYKNLEIIVVNDGSKDLTQAVCEKMIKIDTRIKLISQKNSGVSAARNSGITEATGKYLCFVDADDMVNEAYVENMYKNYEKHKADLTICGYEEKKEDIVINATSGEFQIMTQEEAMEKLFREDSFKGYSVNKLFDMDIVRQHNLRFDVSIKIWEDVLFVFKYLLYCKKIVYDPTPMYLYLYRQDSASHSADHLIGAEKSYSAIKAKDQIIELIPVNYDTVIKQISVRYVQSSLAVIRNIGYAKTNDYSEYYNDCIRKIKIYKKAAYQSLSVKDKILTQLCTICPRVLMILYQILDK